MPADVVALKKFYDRLKSHQSNWLTIWQEIGDYMVPWRNKIVSQSSPGSKQTDRIFDSTAPQALTTASSAVHGSVTPSTVRWFSITVGDPDLLNEEGVPQYLDDLSNRLFSAISNSNFDSEAQEIYSDLLAFGTAAMIVEEKEEPHKSGFQGLVFQAQQPGMFVISEGPDGQVDTFYRIREMPLGAMARRWGIEKLSKASQEMLKKGFADQMMAVLQAVYPREDWNPTIKAPTKMQVADVWIELGPSPYDLSASGAQTLHLLEETGHPEMPIMVPRWRKMSGETYGRSPGMTVLPDVRTLNQAVELRLKAWVLAIAPPIVTQDRGVIGNVRLEPFGRTYVRPGASVDLLEIPSRFDVANFQESELRQSINRGFFVDLLQFQAKPGTPISATEASIHFQTMQRILGPVVSRLQSEFLTPLIQRVMRLMNDAGALPQIPQVLKERGADLELLFEGPLARVQRSADVESINQFFALLFPVAEISREVLARVDFNEFVETLAQATALPARMLVSRDAAKAKLDVEQQAAQQQQQLGNVLQAAEVIGKFSGSPAESAII